MNLCGQFDYFVYCYYYYYSFTVSQATLFGQLSYSNSKLNASFLAFIKNFIAFFKQMIAFIKNFIAFLKQVIAFIKNFIALSKQVIDLATISDSKFNFVINTTFSIIVNLD